MMCDFQTSVADSWKAELFKVGDSSDGTVILTQLNN